MPHDAKQFTPKPGQIDFNHIRWAPVINCVVQFEDKILLVKRSKELDHYPGYWNGISGYLDDNSSLEEKVKEELLEETGVGSDKIESITLGNVFDQEEPRYKKTWIVHPVLVKIKTNEVRTDWEADDYKWVKPSDLQELNLLPGFDAVLKAVFLQNS